MNGGSHKAYIPKKKLDFYNKKKNMLNSSQLYSIPESSQELEQTIFAKKQLEKYEEEKK